MVISIHTPPPEILILKPNKMRILLFSFGLWSFLIPLELLLYWAVYIEKNISSEGPLAFWGLLVLIPVLLFYNLVTFLPKEGWLTLDAHGFQLFSYLYSHRFQYNWDEVQEFFITHQVINTAKIKRVSFSAEIAGLVRQKNFPTYRYQIPPEEVVQTLNDWKHRYTKPFGTEDAPKDASEQSLASSVSVQSTSRITSNQRAEYPAIDPRVEKMTGRWSCGCAIIGAIVFMAFIILLDDTERTIYKIYNLQPNTLPSLTLTVKNEYADGFSVYRLPSIPYKQKLELSIPTPERKAPIQIQYSLNHEPQCRKLQKQYGIWGQMDAFWVNPTGKIDAYAADFCQRVGKYDCRFIPDHVDISECGSGIQVSDKTNHHSGKDPKMKLKPMSSYDFKRLKEKTGIRLEFSR